MEEMISYLILIFNQTRDSWVGGFVHAPVWGCAKDSYDQFNILLSAKIESDKPYKLLVGGFGLDGAVAQLLAFKHAEEEPKYRSHGLRCGYT